MLDITPLFRFHTHSCFLNKNHLPTRRKKNKQKQLANIYRCTERANATFYLTEIFWAHCYMIIQVPYFLGYNNFRNFDLKFFKYINELNFNEILITLYFFEVLNQKK